MAITSSTIRVYSDSDLQHLVKTVTTQSDIYEIDVTTLDEGEVYFATVQVTDSGQTSNESEGYRFYTIPDCYFIETPSAVGTSIYFETGTTTNTVRIRNEGVYCQKTDGRDKGIYVMTDEPTYRGSIDNLTEDTFYTITPCVIDEFGRMYKNTNASQITKTTAAAPTVGIGNLTPTANTVTGNVTVISTVPLTNLLVRLLPEGGGNYINATGYTTQTGTQQFIASGLAANTTYTVYATATNMGGSTIAQATVMTMTVTAEVSLDDCDLDNVSKTDSVYVEVSGSVGSGGTIDTVGAKFFASNSTSSTLIADVYGQQGSGSLATTARNLPAGTTMYVFAYMDYVIDGQTYTVWSQSQAITTVPTIGFNSQNVTTDSCSGSFTVNGTATSTTIKYKTTSGSTWSDATINGNTYSITGLTPNTTYNLKGTVTNASGTYDNQTTFTTQNASAPSISLTITNINATGATANITITE